MGIVLLAAAFAAGFFLRGGGAALHDHETAELAAAVEKAQAWTCSMHPQIRQPKTGKCPLCGMDLIPVAGDTAAAAAAPRQLSLSPAARKLAEVALAPVERRAVAVEIRMVGKVQFDETLLAYISPRVPGRIDRLYANFTGMPVRVGDHLAEMYSPDLVSAQQELLQAVKAAGGATSFAPLLKSARERLRLWGLTSEQIAEIERSGQVREHLTFYSPIGGIVVEKEAREGMYVETGARLFTVADLTSVWVLLDAYETDLAWLHYAQEVTFAAEAYPGETFKGVVTFISPLLDPVTRTVKVRVNVANTDGRLKPEMFVRGTVRATVAGDGKVVRGDLNGKWISPMHPEIVKDGPGACDVCGMPLVRAEDLGYSAISGAASSLPLVVPVSAPLVTGRRAVVYVALPGQEGEYEGREIVLGPRAGDYYLVREGLEEGELVVVNGAFKLDSSLQIQAKPSMMTPEADPMPRDTSAPQPPAGSLVKLAAPAAFRQQVDMVFAHALASGAALAADDLATALRGAIQAGQALAAVDMSILPPAAHEAWMASFTPLRLFLDKLAATKDIEAFRLHFASLSTELIRVAKIFGPLRAAPLYNIHCPMAFNDRGANWLQDGQAVRNPYFGKAMLMCGEVVETLPAAPDIQAPRPTEPAGKTAGGHAHE